ncbi:MAG TPA: rod shape-determining protein MreC [Candidatus Paceibacterota bacterium]|nr:rod shape-determining protein MreC [Candidatus Paceibacterota bacterium]
MKTQFSRRTSVLTPRRGLVLIGVVVVLLLLFGLRTLFPSALTAIVSPLWSAGTSATALLSLGDESGPDAALVTELELLRNENEALRTRLRDVGADRAVPQDIGLLAGVLARPPLSPYDTLILDRGADHGITEGALIYAQGVPIGTVAQVVGQSSRALLFSAPERITEGWVGESRLPVTLIGAGSGVFEADVPREHPVVEGDLVYVPGPGALPIGRVERIESHASSPRALLRIRPLVNPLALTWVRILP